MPTTGAPFGRTEAPMSHTAAPYGATTAPFGTDASILQAIAPCVVMGPGDIGVAHKPDEAVRLAELVAAVPMFQALATRLAG